MNIKKGISLIAFGFAFVLVNLTLTLNGRSICVTPDFVGWILFFMSFDLLGSYIADKAYMKWISLILAIVTGAIWMLKIAAPEMNTSILTTTVTWFPCSICTSCSMCLKWSRMTMRRKGKPRSVC